MSYQKDNLDDFVANAAQPIDLYFKVKNFIENVIKFQVYVRQNSLNQII